MCRFPAPNYRSATLARPQLPICIVAGSVQLSCDGHIVRVHAIQHDRAKEQGAFATSNGRPAPTGFAGRRRVNVHSCGVVLPAEP